MPSEAFEILLEARQAIQGMRTVDNAMNRLNGIFKEFSTTAERFNTKGQQVSRTLTGITQDGRKMTLQLQNTGKGFAVVSQNIESVEKAAARAFREAQKLVAQQNKLANQNAPGPVIGYDSLLRFFEARIAYTGLNAMVSSLKEGSEAAREFALEIGKVQSLAQNTTTTYDQWSKSIISVSNALGVDAADVARGYYSALSNQISDSIKDIERFTIVTTQLANATGGSSAQANDLLAGAINAYGLSVNDANVLSGKFFKTIDLGRITIENLSQSFGRTAVPARTLGVSIDEQLAALAVLTQQGNTAADAQTQLLNLFNKLIKPSENLKKLYAEWGVASGDAAVQTFGFLGILEKLDQELRTGGTARVGEIVNDLRGFRGALGLTGNALETYKDALDKIKNSSGELSKAVALTTENTGRQLTIQFNRVKNYFLNAGQNINEAIVSITKNIANLDTIVAGFVKVGLLGASLAIGVVVQKIGTWIAATYRQAAALGVMNSALKVTTLLAKNIPGLIAGAVTLTLGYIATAESSVQQLERLTADVENDNRERNQRQIDELAKRGERTVDQIREKFSGVSKGLAAISASLKGEFDITSKAFERLGDSLSTFKEAALAGLTEKIASVKRELADLANTSKNLDGIITRFQEKFYLDAFNDGLENAVTVSDKLKLIQQEITKVSIDNLANGKTIENANRIVDLAEQELRIKKEARREQKRLQDEVEAFDKKILANQRAQRSNLADRKRSEEDNAKLKDLREDEQKLVTERYEVQVRLNALNATDLSLTESKRKAEEAILAFKKQSELLDKIAADRKAEELRVLQQQKLELKEQLGIISDLSDPTKLRTELGKASPDDILKRFNAARDKISSILDQTGGSTGEFIQSQDFLNRQSVGLNKLLETLKVQQRIADVSNTITNEQKRQEDLAKKINEEDQKRVQKVQEQETKLEALRRQYKELSSFNPQSDIFRRNPAVKGLFDGSTDTKTVNTALGAARYADQQSSGLFFPRTFYTDLIIDFKTVSDNIKRIQAEGTDAGRAQFELGNKIAELTATLKELQAEAKVLVPGAFARGGSIGYGSDRVPAYLQRGEYIVNADAARRFSNQLIQMNKTSSSARPSVSVGAVNVSVNAVNGNVDPVQVGNAIKKEIRRGVFSW